MKELMQALNSGDNTDAIEILQNLLDENKPISKTELSDAQIELFTKLKWFIEINKTDNKGQDPFETLEKVIEYYMKLKISRKRQSREEIIRALSKMNEGFIKEEPVVKRL